MGLEISRMGQRPSQAAAGRAMRRPRMTLASLLCGTSFDDDPPQLDEQSDDSSSTTHENPERICGSPLTNDIHVTAIGSSSGVSSESISNSPEADQDEVDRASASNVPLRTLPASSILGIHADVVAAANISSQNSSSTSFVLSASQPSLEEERAEGAAIPDPGFFIPVRARQRRSGSILHVDIVSIPSVMFSQNSEDSGNRGARSSRRLFWDAFSRRNSERDEGPPSMLFSSEESDDLASDERWLLNLRSDFFGNDVASDYHSRHSATEQRWRSRSEIQERRHDGLDEHSRRPTLCASGLHRDGTCSCATFLLAEGSGTRASISRIVMLAEALFEVLDEIHRQPVPLSLSMVSQPAPEFVVDSFPLKIHRKLNTAECGDAEQCYICLAEYEEGDRIRVLPCRHEYHMPCVDKWLKEIHGVCPLCRGDVCSSGAECSTTNSS